MARLAIHYSTAKDHCKKDALKNCFYVGKLNFIIDKQLAGSSYKLAIAFVLGGEVIDHFSTTQSDPNKLPGVLWGKPKRSS